MRQYKWIFLFILGLSLPLGARAQGDYPEAREQAVLEVKAYYRAGWLSFSSRVDRVMVVDITGQLVYQASRVQGVALQLKSGIYILRYEVSGTRYVSKILVS